jgi:hypothetical protein
VLKYGYSYTIRDGSKKVEHTCSVPKPHSKIWYDISDVISFLKDRENFKFWSTYEK